MKKKLVIATVAVAVAFSSVISVAAVSAFVREKSRYDFMRSPAYDRARFIVGSAEYALAPAGAQAPAAEAQPPAERPAADQPATPGRGGRGRGAQAPDDVPPTLPIDTPGRRGEFDERYFEEWSRSRNAMRLGQSLTVGPNDIVRDAVVVFGDARIAGRVTGNLIVWFGKTQIARTAVIDGDFLAVGGDVVVQEGATAHRDVVVVGGPFDAPAGFVAGGEQVVIGSGLLGGWLSGAAPYLSRGLLWGRMIVPELPWVWGIVSLFFLLYAALNLIFERPVRACAGTLTTRPLTAFGTGLMVLLLVGPVCVLLAVTVIGIAVVPFIICALIAGALIGKVAVTRWIGMTAVEEDPDGNRAHAARSFVIGFAVLTIAYLIPVLGLITWGITSVLGLGSAAMTFMAAYRRENPGKPPVVVTTPPAAPPPMVPPPAPAYPYSATPPADSPSVAFDGSAAGAPFAPPPFPGTPQPQPVGPYAYAPAATAYPASGLLVAQPRALFRDRLAAFLIDIFVVGVASAFLAEVFDIDGPFFFPLGLIYLIVFWTLKQTTLGGIVCQIRLVRTDGTALTFADALVRGLAGIFSLALLGLGALWILRDPERQAWHDKVAGTYVVKVPRNWPI